MGTAGEDLGGDYTTTVIVSGAGGGSATTRFAWAVTPAPTLTNPGDQSNAAGDDVSVQLEGDGPGSDPLTYSATGLPAGLSVDPDSGLISGTIDSSASAANVVTVGVLDTVTGATATQAINWAVARRRTRHRRCTPSPTNRTR